MPDKDDDEQARSFADALAQYREELVKLKNEMQTSYDKAVLTLSGGALGVSFAFVKDLFDPDVMVNSAALIGAWGCWGLSVTAVLASFFTSLRCLTKAITSVDDQTIYLTGGKGRWNTLTEWLNVAGGILFFAGVVLLAAFASTNINHIRNQEAPSKSPAITTATP